MENQTPDISISSAELAFGFIGNIPLKLDSAQRVQIPSKFKDVLDKRFGSSGGQFVAIPFGQRIKLVPIEVWSKVQPQLESMGTLNAKGGKARALIIGNMIVVGLDGQNRVKLTPRLCERVGLTKEIVLVGICDQLEIWDAAAWDKFNDEGSENLDDILEAALSGTQA